jgi:hypothetical protein
MVRFKVMELSMYSLTAGVKLADPVIPQWGTEGTGGKHVHGEGGSRKSGEGEEQAGQDACVRGTPFPR